MKKIALLFTLTLVGAGQLYGMEALPKELHQAIINMALQSTDNLRDAVSAVNYAAEQISQHV